MPVRYLDRNPYELCVAMYLDGELPTILRLIDERNFELP